MKAYIKPNLDKREAIECASSAAEVMLGIAKRRNEPVSILFDEADKPYIQAGGEISFLPHEQAVSQCDFIVSVGGDGTIMRAAQSAARAGKPVLGVNAGRVGFLTQLEIGELHELERLFTGQYKLLERMMLTARVELEGQVQEFSALNDVVIRHGDADRIVELEVLESERLIASYRADGIIFSTPTGSTAYSMSAGGPVVSPDLKVILMTAICPHSVFHSSLVLSPSNSYTVYEKPLHREHGIYVSIDGVRVKKLKAGGLVTVSSSDTAARFIDLGLREFFSNLNQKLSWRR